MRFTICLHYWAWAPLKIVQVVRIEVFFCAEIEFPNESSLIPFHNAPILHRGELLIELRASMKMPSEETSGF